jgi:hypothetical protein
MARALPLLAMLAFSLAGCNSGGPPAELHGLWSAGPATCAANIGVRFDSDAIAAVYDKQRQTLFEHPRYDVESRGDDFRVRITYALPVEPGGARSVGAHGVIELRRDADGGIGAVSNILLDPRTGSARLRFADDPALAALKLQPCGAPRRGQGLRGRGQI